MLGKRFPGQEGTRCEIRDCPAAVSENDRVTTHWVCCTWEATARRSRLVTPVGRPASPKTCQPHRARRARSSGASGVGSVGQHPGLPGRWLLRSLPGLRPSSREASSSDPHGRIGDQFVGRAEDHPPDRGRDVEAAGCRCRCCAWGRRRRDVGGCDVQAGGSPACSNGTGPTSWCPRGDLNPHAR